MLLRLHELVPLGLCVLAGCDRRVWPAALAGITEAWIDEPCDVGVVQSDDVTVDAGATAERLEQWLTGLSATVDREARRLAGGGFDLVVGDVPPPAFEAADRAGIRSVAIANFTWDWIYGELGFPDAAAAAAAAYAKASLLLEATPCAPMPAFRRRVPVGLIAREPSRPRSAARALLGLGDGQVAVLLAFQSASAPSVVLPPPREGRCYLAPAGWPADVARADLAVLSGDASFEDALAAADVVVGKPGYGLIGDVEAAGARFLFVPRPGFPENAVLERHLSARTGTAPLTASRLGDGTWHESLDAVCDARRPAPAEAAGATRAAHAIAELLQIDSGGSAQ